MREAAFRCRIADAVLYMLHESMSGGIRLASGIETVCFRRVRRQTFFSFIGNFSEIPDETKTLREDAHLRDKEDAAAQKLF